MTLVKTETKNVDGVSRVIVTYQCPKSNCATGAITIQRKTGFQNPYAHLRSCYGRGKKNQEQDEILQSMYREAVQAHTDAGGTIRSHFKSETLSPREKVINKFLRLIVLESAPFEIVESVEYRRAFEHPAVTTAETVKETMLKLVELVEQRVRNDICGKKGALLFDGWSKRGVHYVEMIASYTREVVEQRKKDKVVHEQQALAMLALSPMAKTPESNESERNMNCEEEAVKCNAETHLRFFRDNFRIFDCDFDQWVVCMISDNCSLNQKISRDSSKPLVGCLNHKLNLQVNKMVRSMPHLSQQIDSIQNTMYAVKRSTKTVHSYVT